MPGSAADTVRRSRLEHGITWIVSAGNEGDVHWSGRVGDTDRDGWMGVAAGDEAHGFRLPADGLVTLQWDAWPRTTADLDLLIMSANRPPTLAVNLRCRPAPTAESPDPR